MLSNKYVQEQLITVGDLKKAGFEFSKETKTPNGYRCHQIRKGDFKVTILFGKEYAKENTGIVDATVVAEAEKDGKPRLYFGKPGGSIEFTYA